MSELYREVAYFTNHMSTQEWLAIAAVAVLIGLLCMRGLGSRSTY